MSELESLRAELSELQAKKAERDAERAKKNELVEARAEIARAKLDLENAEVIDRFEEELGERGERWEGVDTPAGIVIVKRPHPATYKRFRDRGKYNSQSLDELVRPCLAHPDKSEVASILNEYPAVLDHLADAVVELAGARNKEVSEK